jgi:hypothetical protein
MMLRITSGFLTLLLSVTLLVFSPGGSNQRGASATVVTNKEDSPNLKITGFDQVGAYPVRLKSATFTDWASYVNPPSGFLRRTTELFVCDLRFGDFSDPNTWIERYGKTWCVGWVLEQPQSGEDHNRMYTSKEKDSVFERIRAEIQSSDGFANAYKIFVKQWYVTRDQAFNRLSDPITVLSDSPRVLGRDLDTTIRANVFYTRPQLGNSIEFDWYVCSKYHSKPQTQVPKGCSPLVGGSLNAWGAMLDERSDLNKYFALRVTGTDGSFQYFSKTTSAIQKSPLAIGLEPTNIDDSDSTSLSAPIGTTYKLTLSTGIPSSINDPHIGNYRCPKSALVSIKNLASGYVSRKTIKLSSSSGGDPADCTGRISVPVQANMRVQVELPSTYWTSKSTETIVVKGEPSLSASAPKRAFDSYVLRLKANRPVTTTCNVREEYFSFGGDLIATKWFSISLRYGYATKKRTTYYVGVIRAMVTCKSTSKYDVAIDTYKVFSY